MSSMRPFVQEPITAWSILTLRLSATVFVFDGRCGHATVGSSADSSISILRAYAASWSERYAVHGRSVRPSSQLRAIPFTSKMPALAPASITMLEIVIRASMESCSTAEPRNSSAWYKAPSTPIMPMRCKMRSLPVTPGVIWPVSSTLIVDGTLNHAWPVAMPTPASVEPTPVENAPSAP